MAEREGIALGTPNYVPGSENQVVALVQGHIDAAIIDLLNKNMIMEEHPDDFRVLSWVSPDAVQPHWVTFGSSELVDVLPSIVRTQDEPFGSTSIVAQWFVMRAAKQAGLTVMLDGQGADETPPATTATSGRSSPTCFASASSASSGGAPRVPRPSRRRRRHDRGRARRPFLPERVRWAARGRVKAARRSCIQVSLRRAPSASTGSSGGYLRRQMH